MLERSHRHFARNAAGCMLAAYAMLFARQACACEGMTVAQSLFQNRRDVHLLVVIGPQDDPDTDAAHQRLADWLAESGSQLNVEVQRAAFDDPAVIWSDFGFRSPPEQARFTVLVARHTATRLAMIVDRWEPAPTEKELLILRDSPLREQLRSETPLNLGAIVFSPQVDGPPDGAALSMLEDLSETWRTQRNLDVPVLQLNRADPRERTLVRFVGIHDVQGDWAGVFAGRAVMLFPPLKDDTLTRANVNRLLEKLAGPCTCIENPRALGVEIPLVWTKADETLAAAASEPAYTEQVIALAAPAPPPREDEVDEAFQPPNVLAAGGLAAAVMATLSLLFIAVSWRQWRRRNRSQSEEA